MKGTPVFPGGVGQLRVGRLAVAAAAFACIATAAGCASSSSQPAAPTTTVTVTTAPAAPGSASNSTPASTPSSPVTGPPACPTSSLQVKQGVSQGYAGGVYEVIDFTNTSGSPCSLYGYPGVSLVSGPPYTQIGLAAKRTASTRPKLVTLAPGATANALLQIVDALNYPQRQLRTDQGDRPEDLPAQPDRPRLPAQHLERLRQVRPDHVHRPRPARRRQLLLTRCPS